MSKKLSKSEIVDKFLSETPKEYEYFIQHSMELSIRIIELLKKNNLTQRDLSSKLGKSESEISKWLSGNHNLTLKSIAKIEAIFCEQIIFTVDKDIERTEDQFLLNKTSFATIPNKFDFTFSSKNTVSIKSGSNSYNSAEVPLSQNIGDCKLYSITKDAA